MKKLAMILSLLSVSSLSFAASKALEVNCKAAVNGPMTGGATVTGSLLLSKHPTYPAPAKQAEGDLLVKVGGSTRSMVLNEKLSFLGQYDSIKGSSYAHVASKPNGNVALYIDFTNRDGSRVEYKGQTYLMNCVK